MIKILRERVENLSNYDDEFDVVYLDPPFGLDREFFMFEKDKKVAFDDNGSQQTHILSGMHL